RRHTRSKRDWSSDVCSSDILRAATKYEDYNFVIHSTIWSSMRGPSSSFSKLFNKIEKISSRLFSVFTYPDNVLTPWIVPVLALTAKPCKRLLNVPPTIRQFIPLTGNDFKNDRNQASR